MNCKSGPIENIDGYDIHTMYVNGVKLYHVNDYEDKEYIELFSRYLEEERTCLFLDSLGDRYQILHYTRNNHKRCDHIIEDDYYVSKEILEDYMEWCSKLN